MSISNVSTRQIFIESPKQQLFKELFLKSDKQKEAWMRYFHALSVACVIGTVTVLFTEYEMVAIVVSRIFALVFGALFFFFTGLNFGRNL
jgi:hypothetical protein